MAIMRKRGTVIAVIAPVIILAFVAFLVAKVNDDGPDTAASPTASASASVEPEPTPTPSGPLPTNVKATCASGSGGRLLSSFDAVSGWSVFMGKGKLNADPSEKREGTASLAFDNGQSVEESWAQRKLSAGLDLSKAKEFRVWIHQNGNLIANFQDWRLRLVSPDGSFFERVFPQPTVGEAATWCQDSSRPAEWRQAGTPDWAKIVAIQINVPKYPGSGAKNLVNFDGFSVVE